MQNSLVRAAVHLSFISDARLVAMAGVWGPPLLDVPAPDSPLSQHVSLPDVVCSEVSCLAMESSCHHLCPLAYQDFSD